MKQLELVVPTLFGLEAFAAREIKRLGYEDVKTEDGKITFSGDARAVCRANLWLRTGERVLVKAAEFDAVSFEELFEKTKAVDWTPYFGKHSAFPVKGHCLKSTLASVRDCQAIIKKAIAASLGAAYGEEWLPEDGEVCQLQFSVLKDKVTLLIDTSGAPLHKRGYRLESNLAPLRETIAASMVLLSYWKYEYPLWDPFCGSGTILIEGAMIKRNMAPGLNRSFAGELFPWIPSELWTEEREQAKNAVYDVPLEIYGSDTDKHALKIARENAKRAGVEQWIQFSNQEAEKIASEKSYGTIICNPPYGERLGEKKACELLYRAIGKSFPGLKNWSYYILTSHENFEVLFGARANKKRKIYNGMIKCNLYQYFGPKPLRS